MAIEEVKEMAAKLDFDRKNARFGGTARIYKQYFNVEYSQIDRCPEILFSSVPEWPEKTRIKRQTILQ